MTTATYVSIRNITINPPGILKKCLGMNIKSVERLKWTAEIINKHKCVLYNLLLFNLYCSSYCGWWHLLFKSWMCVSLINLSTIFNYFRFHKEPIYYWFSYYLVKERWMAVSYNNRQLNVSVGNDKYKCTWKFCSDHSEILLLSGILRIKAMWNITDT